MMDRSPEISDLLTLFLRYRRLPMILVSFSELYYRYRSFSDHETFYRLSTKIFVPLISS